MIKFTCRHGRAAKNVRRLTPTSIRGRDEESRSAGLVAGSTDVPFATTEQDPKRVFSSAYVKKDRKLHVHEKVKIESIPISMARGF